MLFLFLPEETICFTTAQKYEEFYVYVAANLIV